MEAWRLGDGSLSKEGNILIDARRASLDPRPSLGDNFSQKTTQ
jgi:hypothetical protein